jgi:CO/xanthine dehydrogenase FAD-binding subunit
MIAEFVIAEDLAQVRSLMNKGYMLIAGGTQINNGARIAADPHWFDGEQRLVSLQKLDLGNITVDDSGALKIGAMVSLQDLADDQRIPGPFASPRDLSPPATSETRPPSAGTSRPAGATHT